MSSVTKLIRKSEEHPIPYCDVCGTNGKVVARIVPALPLSRWPLDICKRCTKKAAKAFGLVK